MNQLLHTMRQNIINPITFFFKGSYHFFILVLSTSLLMQYLFFFEQAKMKL